MYRATYTRNSSALAQRRGRKVAAIHQAVSHALEPLESRRLYAVTAVSAGGVLTVLGDNNNNTINISRDTAGKLLINNGSVKIVGSIATVANTTSINVFGFNGNDSLTLDETNGALPKASLVGGNGKDTLTGGSGADVLAGGGGNDVLLGKGGADSLFGGSGTDVLTGGAGSDQAAGQSGNDRMIWNPGDGSDTNDGGSGNDTVEVNGGNVDETFSVTPNGARVKFDRTSPAPFSIDIGTSENLTLNANGGNDTFTGSVGLGSLISIRVDGGAGNDTITGGDGADTILGGDGNDSINGGRGSDAIFLGAGDDIFVWNPGEGSDVVEGQDGADTMVFNGADAAENVDLSANGSRLRFFRDVGNITMDLDGVETVQFNAKGGADTITVHDLSATDVTNVGLNFEASAGGGNGAIDTVIVEGTSDDDVITVNGSVASGIAVTGLANVVNITGAEATDKLSVNSIAGDDLVDASSLAANVILYSANGGDGDDVLIGSAGDDTLLGGNDDDMLIGGTGTDQLDGGAGDNVVVQ